MKPLVLPLFALLVSAMPAVATPADDPPLPAPRAEVMQFVGVTPITVSYSSPAVNDRKIWGGAHPFGQNWIAWANAKTTISFEENVKINGNDLPAGVYGFYIFLNRDDDWQLVFSRDSAGDSTDFNRADDVLRVAVTPQMAPHRERLQFGIEDFTDEEPYRAQLYLHWEKKKVALEVKMTGHRPSASDPPEIPREARAAWAVVQRSLGALVAEEIEEAIVDFAEDFETEFGDGGGKAAYAQLMNNLKRGGMLEEMDVDLSDLSVAVEGDEAVFKNIKVRAPVGAFTLFYVLERRDGRWVVVSLDEPMDLGDTARAER